MILQTSQINECRLCKSQDLIVSLDYGLMPMAGGFYELSDERSQAVAPLRLGICNSCGLMQTLDTVDPNNIFSQYSYRSSVSKELVSHFNGLSDQIERIVNSRINDVPKCLDIGCNDGILLLPLKRKGYTVVGVDPSDVADQASIGQWDHVKRYMNVETARIIKQVYGEMDIVTACNVLAHTDNIHEMVAGIKHVLSSNGVFIVEVQYQGSLLDRIQFDTVYHEHCSYFSSKNLIRLFFEHGLTAWNIRRIATHSGSIRLIGSHSDKIIGRPTDHVTSSEMDVPAKQISQDFCIAAQKARSRIQRVFGLIGDRQRTKRSIAYGAAGRSTILINWCNLDKSDIEFVIDASPLRQGKVIPVAEIPIVSPTNLKNNIDLTLITAWNYADHIISQHPHHKGLWMIPLPDVRIV